MMTHIEARITGDRFSTFAMPGNTPDEIQGARIVGAYMGKQLTFWLLKSGERYIRLVTREGKTSGAYVIGGEQLRAEFIARAAALGASIVWGSS